MKVIINDTYDKFESQSYELSEIVKIPNKGDFVSMRHRQDTLFKDCIVTTIVYNYLDKEIEIRAEDQSGE